MSWANVADLANVAVRGTFGVSVTYTPASTAVAESIVAPFDAAYVAVAIQAGQEITSVRPVIDVRLADLTVAPAVGDGVVVGGVSYVVEDLEPGGHGMTRCYLVRA